MYQETLLPKLQSEHKRMLKKILFLIIYLILPIEVGATTGQCSNTFTNSLNGVFTNSTVNFTCGASLSSPTSTVLSLVNVNNPTGNCTKTCASANCSALGVPVNIINPTFQTSNSTTDLNAAGNGTLTYFGNAGVTNYRNITVASGGYLAGNPPAGTPAIVSNITVGANAYLAFEPGDYWINNLTMDPTATIVTYSATQGSIRLFVNGSITIPNSVTLYGSSSLFIYSNQNVTINSGFNVPGVIYAQNKLNLLSNASITGAAVANMTNLAAGATITYNASTIAGIDYSTICDAPPSNTATSFNLVHTPANTNCNSVNVTVNAKYNSNQSINYIKTIVLDTQTGSGDWSLVTGNGTFNQATANNGVATYTYDLSDNAQAVFSLAMTSYPATVTLNAYEQSTPTIKTDGTDGSISFTCGVVANSCTNVFKAATQTNSSGSAKVVFGCGAQSLSNTSTILPTVGITNPNNSCAKTCGTANCTASGTATGTISPGTFQTSAGGTALTISSPTTIGTTSSSNTEFGNITVNGTTLNFADHSSVGTNYYHMNTLTLAANSIVNFLPGDYWINTLSVTGTNVQFNVVGTGTARIYINTATSINQKILWNTNNSISNPAQSLLIYSYNTFAVNTAASKIVGFIYSPAVVTLGNSVTLIGGINGNGLTLGTTTTATYDGIAALATDFGKNFGTACESPGTVDNFLVSGNTSVPYCQLVPIKVSARSGTSLVANYTNQIILNTGNGVGTWTVINGNGTFNQPTANSGIAYYNFDPNDEGTASFSLDYPASGSATPTITVKEQGYSTISGSLTLNFTNSTIIVSSVAVQNPPATLAPDFATTETAGTNFTAYLTNYGKVGTSCGINTSYTGSKNIKFWSSYINPMSGTKSLLINGTSIATSPGSAVARAITFTNGVATVTANYPDVGIMQFALLDTGTGSATGSTGNFVVKPANLVITVPSNPAASSASGSVFTKAGQAFTASVQVQNSAGALTPNFGNEIPAQSLLLSSSSLVLPSGGRNGTANNGVLGNGTNFTMVSPGNFQGTAFTFDEVGIIKLVASINGGSYLGAGDVTGTISGNVGRFTPDNFDVSGNTPAFSAACVSGAFTYLDQPFKYSAPPIMTVTARNVAGTTTQNYTGAFWKLPTSLLNTIYDSNLPTATLNSTAALSSVSFADNANGTGTFTFGDGGGLSFQRVSGTDIANFSAEMRLRLTVTDSDSVSYGNNPFTFGNITSGNGISFIGGKNFYQGRMYIKNGSGSELLPLNIPIILQYYSNGGYNTNTNDSCTVFNNPSWLTLTPTPSSLSTSASLSGFSGGINTLTLSAPTPKGTTGYVTIQANLSSGGAAIPWLQYYWNYTGNALGNPVGQASFGGYQGNTKIIYQRELY
ncbi:MAG: hypothetical protein JWM09_1173 [Francisellaceae bacterium]|nr:hypothetical protein [Francisellaceae bacterium]